MIEFLTEPANLPFAVSLGLMVLIGIIEGVGMLIGVAFSGLLDSLVPELDIDLDVDVDGDMGSPGAVSEFLSWLRFREVPVIAILIAFLTSFGITGILLQQIVAGLFGFLLPALVAGVLAFVICLPGVRLFAGVMAHIMPRDDTSAISTDSFIGRTAVITLGTATTGSPAQGKFDDQFGTTHYVMLEPDNEGEEFTQGAEVLIVRQSGATFFAIPAKPTAG
jgi:hypothetical protein